MCVIVHKPASKSIPYADLIDMSIRNPDGIGIAILFPELNQVKVKRDFTSDQVDQLADYIDQFPNREMVIHFRLATHGVIGIVNNHPYPITRHESKFYESELIGNSFLVHNGVIGIDNEKYNPVFSDTAILALMLAKMNRSARLFTLEMVGDSWNRFCYITPHKVIRFGKFESIKGIYFSNLLWRFNYTYQSLKSNVKSNVKSVSTLIGNQSEDESIPYWNQSISPTHPYCYECGKYLIESNERDLGLCLDCQVELGIITDQEYDQILRDLVNSYHEKYK